MTHTDAQQTAALHAIPAFAARRVLAEVDCGWPKGYNVADLLTQIEQAVGKDGEGE